MKLYLMRHADALEGGDDAARPLSSIGKTQTREVARLLNRAAIEFDAAYSSPLVRARQTAEIVLETCGSGALENAEVLLNETSHAHFSEWLKGLPAAKHVLLVGHAPSLAERVRRFIGLSNPEALKLAKGAIACVETEDRRTAALKFLVTPRLLGARAD
jgi:phosphohistidine phosphatase